MPIQRQILARLAAAISTVTLWSGAALLNVAASGGGHRVRRDVPYGADPDQRLDIYVPHAPWSGAGARPTVVFVHGGSWESGDKGLYRFVAEALTSRGWVAVIPDYRKYPRARWPLFMEDGADALSWVADHVAEWGGDRARLIAMGHSAGAHIVALLALDTRFLARASQPVRLAGVVGLSGPYDFLPITDPTVQQVFAPASDLDQTQPIRFAHAGAPPMLLLHGERDETVLPRNAVNLAACLRAVGAVAHVRLYPGLDHVRTLVALGRPYRLRSPLLDDIAGFIDATAGAGGACSVADASGSPALLT